MVYTYDWLKKVLLFFDQQSSVSFVSKEDDIPLTVKCFGLDDAFHMKLSTEKPGKSDILHFIGGLYENDDLEVIFVKDEKRYKLTGEFEGSRYGFVWFNIYEFTREAKNQ